MSRSRAAGSARSATASTPGSLQRGDRLKINLELETGETYSGEGELVSPGTTVSTTTGTTEMRLRFDNAERRIMPGQYLRVDMTLGHHRGGAGAAGRHLARLER